MARKKHLTVVALMVTGSLIISGCAPVSDWWSDTF